MSVFTFAGGKGGVGKSTTTASLGVALSRAGLDVVLVDADLAMANLADVLGVESDRGIHHVLAGEAAVEDVVVKARDRLGLVPGGQDLDLFEAADPANLRDVVEPVAERADVVLVDTGAGLGHETLVATGLADHAVLVTTPAPAAVEDVAKTGEFVAHADADVLGAVVTRTTAETDLTSVADELAVPLLGAVPDDPTVGTDPVTAGETGLAYEHLAATVLTCSGEDAPVEASAAVPRSPAACPTLPADEGESGEGPDASGDGLFGRILSLGD